MKVPKKLIFAVTNDLSFDQRMDRICSTLTLAGYDVTLIGRELKESLPLKEKKYTRIRLKCIFEKGKLFYIEYNLKLFFRLMQMPVDVFGAIDLDTALPVYIAAKLKRKKWTFDAHEYFSELEEVLSRPIIHIAWQWIEAFIIKRSKHAYTISYGYAGLFKKRYGTEFRVVRNVPTLEASQKSDLKTEKPPYLIYQGVLNIGRGLEESVLAMRDIDKLTLRIYGNGPIKADLENLIEEHQLGSKVQLCGTVLPEELKAITRNAFAGLTLFSKQGKHHQYSLANRFFDYFHAEIPQICVSYHEYKLFNHEYEIAITIDQPEVKQITSAIKTLQNDQELYQKLKRNCERAAKANNWQTESTELLEIYDQL
ncbi:MAG: glycosyltransferase [Salibacteraceae bacterium]